MSRSNSNHLTSPAQKKFEWQGSTGKIKYYDRAKEENVVLDLPFSFLPLDRLHTIAGYSDADKGSFWSNEVRNIDTEKLTVRTKKGVYQTDLYKNLSPTLNDGAKYAQAVYVAYYEGDKLEIGKFEIYGSAIGAWIDFCKGKDVDKIAVTISGATPEKKGATKYFVPVFEVKQVSDDAAKAATALDIELQKYFTAYFPKTATATSEPPEETSSRMQPNPNADKSYSREQMSKSEYVPTAPTDDLPF